MIPILVGGLAAWGLWRLMQPDEAKTTPPSAGATSPGGVGPSAPSGATPGGTVVVGPPPPRQEPSASTPQGAGPSSASGSEPYRIKDRQRLEAAATIAARLAVELTQKKKNASKQLIREFQRVAALAIDGVYGPKTAGALRWYTMQPPARPNGIEIPPHVGQGFATYAPPF